MNMNVASSFRRFRQTLRNKTKFGSGSGPEKKRSAESFRLTMADYGDRASWGSEREFVLSCIGMSVGLGNFWRFPTLAYENGGAAFFLPYIILQVLIGNPMYLLELSLGQYSGTGPTGVFRCTPIARGVGVSMVVCTVLISLYYNSILALCLYYMFASMQGTLPWARCKDDWIYNHCYDVIPKIGVSMPVCGRNITPSVYTTDCKCSGNRTIDFNITQYPSYVNFTYERLKDMAQNASNLLVCTHKIYTPSHFYFYEDVTQRTNNDLRIGFPIWSLILCLLLSSIIVVICLLKGVKSLGKVVYFTVTFPYVVILILLIRTALLDGAVDGVRLFLFPDWHRLSNIDVSIRVG